MRISHSVWRKLVVTLVAATGFILVYQATMFDSKYAARQAVLREEKADPEPGTRLRFLATAYCSGNVTRSGVQARTGIAAADPDVLPPGSVVQISKLGERYDGIYTIMDTGPVVTGRQLDLYLRNCSEATRFGRQAVEVFVLRLGWNPRATGPSLLDALLPWRTHATHAPAASPAASPPASPPGTRPRSPASPPGK